MPRGKKAKKLPIGLDEAFFAEVAALDTPGKKALVARIESGKIDAVDFLKNNEVLITLREQKKELEGPARDTIKAATNKQRYIVEELKKAGEF